MEPEAFEGATGRGDGSQAYPQLRGWVMSQEPFGRLW